LPAHGNYSAPWGVKDFVESSCIRGNLFLQSRRIVQVNFVTLITLRFVHPHLRTR
jgi:hypothetical protein